LYPVRWLLRQFSGPEPGHLFLVSGSTHLYNQKQDECQRHPKDGGVTQDEEPTISVLNMFLPVFLKLTRGNTKHGSKGGLKGFVETPAI